MAKIDVVCPRCSETHGVIRNGHSGYWFEGPNHWVIFPEDVDMIEDHIK